MGGRGLKETFKTVFFSAKSVSESSLHIIGYRSLWLSYHQWVFRQDSSTLAVLGTVLVRQATAKVNKHSILGIAGLWSEAGNLKISHYDMLLNVLDRIVYSFRNHLSSFFHTFSLTYMFWTK